MNKKKLKISFNFNIFYFLLILLSVISFSFQNIAFAQNTNQQQPANAAEHFSLVLPLDNENKATVNYSFQQNNLFAFIYGKSNIKVVNLDTENIVYKASCPESYFLSPYLVGNYLLYLKRNGKNYETIRIDLSTEEKESISFPGSSNQITDDGDLIAYYENLCQLIDLDVGEVIFEPDVSKGGRGKILCVDDLIIFPFSDRRGNNAGYKALSTIGEEKFTLEEIYDEMRIFLPHYYSKISNFPIPILLCSNYNDPNEEQWLLKFIDKGGQTIISYSPYDLGINYSYGYSKPTPLMVLDENQNKSLFRMRYYKKGESQRYYYILADSSGNILNVFDENVFDETNAGGFDNQGNILIFQNREGDLQDILSYYRQDGSLIFSKQIPSVVSSKPGNFKLLGEDEILAWTYNKFEKYSLIDGELTGIYPISTDYKIYLNDTVTYNDEVYFFANSRGGFKPPIPGSNLFSFSAADCGWLDIELVSIRPNAGTTYEVWDNTEVKLKFSTEYGASFGENLTVNFEKGELIKANNKNLEYTWHTPTITSDSEIAKITVSYGPVSREFFITIKDHIPTASFTFEPDLPQTGQTVHFDASASADLDGEITSYHWDFGDGTDDQEQEQDYIDHIFSAAGEYLVTLTVTDNNGQTNQISQNIKIAPCSYNLSKDNSHFSSSGGTGEFTVTSSNSDCQWTAVSDVHWIEVVSGGSGPGSKILHFSAQNNNSGEERTGHISIENEIYTITQKPKLELNLSNQGRTLTSNLPIFVKEDEVGNTEIDPDGDGIWQEWEGKAMEYINPKFELDEDEEFLDYPEHHVVNFVRVFPYPNEFNRQYLLFTYCVTWSRDYGRVGFAGHNGDVERVIMAWKITDPEGKNLQLKKVFTSAHGGDNDHSAVWDAWDRSCFTCGIALWPVDEEMCGKLVFKGEILKLQVSEDKHAIYPTEDCCEAVKLTYVPWNPVTGVLGFFVMEDCGDGITKQFECYNAGEPVEPGDSVKPDTRLIDDLDDPSSWKGLSENKRSALTNFFPNEQVWSGNKSHPDKFCGGLDCSEKSMEGITSLDSPGRIGNKLENLPKKLTKKLTWDMATYKITVKTSKLGTIPQGEGTDANVLIELIGRKSDGNLYASGELSLDNSGHDDFQRGATDTFTFFKKDIGELEYITLQHDNFAPGAAWHCENIEVKNQTTDREWTFSVNAWLEKQGDINPFMTLYPQ